MLKEGNMKNDTKFALNIYSIAHYQAFESYLGKMAKKGWLIKSIDTMLVFKRVKPNNFKFCIKIFDGKGVLQNGSEPNLKVYRNIAKESGWDFVTSYKNMQVFYAPKDVTTQPLMSDTEIEYKAIKKSILRLSVIVSIALIPFLLSTILDICFTGYAQLLRNKDIAFLLCGLLVAVALLVLITKDIPWLIKARMSVKKNDDLPKRASWHTQYSRFFIIFLVIIGISIVASSVYFENTMKTIPYENANVITLNELNQDVSYEKSIPYKAYSSVFVPNSYFYMEKAKDKDEPYIYTSYYEAKNSKIADNLFNYQLSQAKQDGRKIIKEGNAQKLWNADEVYYMNDGNTFALIKAENRIYLIKSSFNFNDKNIIEKCKNELGL